MPVLRILTIAMLSVGAYYLFFYLAVLWQFLDDLVTRGIPDYFEVWWPQRRQAIATGVVGACIVAGIMLWRRRKTTNWRELTITCVVLAVVIGVQPAIQLEMLKRSYWERLERGEHVAASLAMLGEYEAIPKLVESTREGGKFALLSAKNAIRFGERLSIERIALDPAAYPSARTASALALMAHPQLGSDPRLAVVLHEVLRDPDPQARIVMLQRLREAESGLMMSSELITQMREQLLFDPDPRVRLAALQNGHIHVPYWGCEAAPKLFRDPERDVQLASFGLFQHCHRYRYRGNFTDRETREHVELYLTLLDHPEPDIRAGAAAGLFALGNNAGVDVAMEFVRGNPAGKNAETMVGAIEVIARDLKERVVPILWTISRCESRHDLRSRTAAESELLEIYTMMRVEVPVQYRLDSPNPAPLLSDFCPS